MSSSSTPSTRRSSLAAGLFLATCASLLGAVPAQAADLTVVVSNITSNAGNVMVGLFDSAAAFPKTVTQGVLAAAAGRDATGRVTLVLRDLTPGTYAVSVYHDLDANGQLNNIISINIYARDSISLATICQVINCKCFFSR